MEYIATAHPPSSVTHSLLANVTAPETPSLVIFRTSSIELLNLLPTGPVSALPNGPFQLWGRILGAQTIALSPSALPILVVLLDAPKPICLFLRWSEERQDLETIESVAVNGGVGATEAEFWQGVEVDRERGVVLLKVWRGMVTVLVLRMEEVESTGAVEGQSKAKIGKKSRRDSIRGDADGVVLDKFDVQLKQLNVLSLTLLPSPNAAAFPNPTLVLLSLTPTRTPHLTSHTIDLATKDILAPLAEGDVSPTPLSAHISDVGANMVVPLPRGGVMVVGEKEVVVYEIEPSTGGQGKGKGKETGPPTPGKRRRSSVFSADGGNGPVPGAFPGGSPSKSRARLSSGSRGVVGKMPAFAEARAYSVLDTTDKYTRVLLGDSYGRLTLATLRRSGPTARVSSVDFLVLGEIPSPMTLTYLSSSHLFVGSHFGDSIITAILPKPTPYTGSYLSPNPLLTLPNLAPILDFWKDGEEGDVVTCSGGQNTGSIRIVRRGVGLVEGVVVDGIEGVQGIWGLKPMGSGPPLALLSTASLTLVLSLGSGSSADDMVTGDSASPDDVALLDPSTFVGLDHHVPTLLAGSVASSEHMFQVTKTGLILVDAMSGVRADEWNSPNEVTVAAFDGRETVVVGAQGGELSAVSLRGGKVSLQKSCILLDEIAALSLSTAPNQPTLLAVSLWSRNLSLYSPSSLESLVTLPPTTALSRSLLFAALGSKGSRQLLAGLGDGSVVVQELSTDGQMLGDRRTIGLGTTEVGLKEVEGGSVFASCDRPSVLHEEQGRLGYSSVNLKNLATSAYLESSTFPHSLVLATSTSLIFGKISEMKKVHVQTIPFGHDVPYRIAHQPSLRAYGIAFVKTVLNRRDEEEDMTSSFKLLDEDTFEPTFTFDLETGERASSIESLTIFGRPFFVLGTGTVDRSRTEVQQGRILLFGETPGGGKVELVSEFATGGGVFVLSWLEGKGKLAASVNSRVLLLDVGSDHQLTKSAIWGSAYMPASLAPVNGGERLLVGDAMSSMSLVDVGDESLRTVAKDARPLWMTTVAPLSDEVMIGGDSNCNILTMKLDDKNKLEAGGAFNVGELVNRFRKGSLVPNQPSSAFHSNLLLATSSGRLSTLIDLDFELSRLLFDLQRNMARVVEGPGGVTFSRWRDFKTDNGATPSVGFIDGDLVERFLVIPEDDPLMKQIMEGSNKYEKLSVSYSEMCTVLEGLRRMH